jgi:hypothetical protein
MARLGHGIEELIEAGNPANILGRGTTGAIHEARRLLRPPTDGVKRWALQLQPLDLPTADEPFAAVILCTSDPGKVDKRTRSKWSRVLRYAAEYKTSAEPLAAFVRRKGGINKCAERFTCCFGRRRQSTAR